MAEGHQDREVQEARRARHLSRRRRAGGPGYWECLDLGLLQGRSAEGPTCTTGGGTSVAAPQWAGVTAIIVQKKGRVGNINPQLYAMAKANASNLTAVGIRDVTIGNNSYFPLTGYDAVPATTWPAAGAPSTSRSS